MPFLSLSLVNFRNLKSDSIDLLSKEVFFCGENGQGKSNFLESLYFSSYGSSFRTHADAEMIRNGESAASVRTMYREESGSTHSTFLRLEKKEKLIKRIEKDGKTLHDRKDLVTTMPCILYNHDDMDFVVGEPERRRFFVDQSLSMYDVIYIDVSRRYKRVLKSRNMSLKERKYDLLDSYDLQLASFGLEIQKKRKSAIFQFNQIFGKLYQQIAGIEGVSIRYSPSWNFEEGKADVQGALEIIRSKRDGELVLQTTLSGPHRDRISFVKDGRDFVSTASTGQRRLLALILRSAQAIFYSQITSRKPVLLMDDVMLELDPDKRQRFTELLPDYDQLFCTFLPGEPFERYIHSTTKIYEIKNGEWTAR